RAPVEAPDVRPPFVQERAHEIVDLGQNEHLRRRGLSMEEEDDAIGAPAREALQLEGEAVGRLHRTRLEPDVLGNACIQRDTRQLAHAHRPKRRWVAKPMPMWRSDVPTVIPRSASHAVLATRRSFSERSARTWTLVI